MESDAPRVAFVCVQNAGRSQMSAAFARREADRRDLDVEVLTGGTDPADAVHPEVVEVMDELDVDLSGREPREIPTDELESCRLVATMGCSTLELDATRTSATGRCPTPTARTSTASGRFATRPSDGCARSSTNSNARPPSRGSEPGLFV